MSIPFFDPPSPPYVLTRFASGRVLSDSFFLLSDPVEILSGQGEAVLSALRRIEQEGEWFGFLGYELGEVTESVPPRPPCDWGLPDCWFARFDSCREVSPRIPDRSEVEASGAVRASLTRAEYTDRLTAIRDYLEAGDIYQVNLSVQFEADKVRDPLALFLDLETRSKASFACFLDLGDWKILSLSPELFLHIEGGTVLTRPIKGTIGRTCHPEGDRAALEWLIHSPKNLAELLMIVDLERNDLGRLCRYGSVSVDSFPEVLELPHLYHLSAAIRGTLREGVTLAEILHATFPGGSISGAPKRRALEIVRELEPHRRGPYCGAIGSLSAETLHLNLGIRTAVWREGRMRFWGGGGIVVDHDPEVEQKEIVDKLSPFLGGLGLDREKFWREEDRSGDACA